MYGAEIDILPLSLFSSEADDVTLQMVSRPYLQAQIDKLHTQDKYSAILQLGQFAAEEIA